MTWRPFTIPLASLALWACTAAAPSGPSAPPPVSHRTPVAEGGMCGGIAGFQCGEGLTCEIPPSQSGVFDASGVCHKLPQVCTMIYAPVCGRDGKTYASACTAASKGVSVAAQGECKA